MKTSILEKAFFAVIAAIMIYFMFFTIKIVDHQNKCMAAIISDLLSGNIIASQVVCSGAIK